MMISKLLLLVFVVIATAAGDDTPTRPEFWKGTVLDSHVERMKTSCSQEDTIACFQYKAFKFLDSVFRKDYFQVGENVEVKRNNHPSTEVSARSESNLEDGVEDFIKTHDVTFSLPAIGDVTVDSSGLDNEEIGLKWNFGGEEGEGRGLAHKLKKKPKKLKKILSPILIFLLLKAITLVPFAIGVLGLKAWNGLQLAFISFIISTGLAIFQLCQKLASDHAHSHAHIATSPYEAIASPHWARSLEGAQEMAYSAYSK